MMKEKNTTLWDNVCTTNPDITKKVNYGRGFTTICAQSQIKAATEQFGAYGIGWGIDFDGDEYIRDGSGNILEYVYKGTLWYLWDGKRGTIPCQSSIKYKAGDDVQVKAETHARSKALSKLGFNSDVYEGKFDDNKYVQQQRERDSATAEKQKVLRQLTAACNDAKFDKKQKARLIEEWCLHFGVVRFDDLSIKQIEEVVTEVKKQTKLGN